MCCLHSDIAVLSLLFPSLSYHGVRIVYYSNQPQSLVINISTTWTSLFYIFLILLYNYSSLIIKRKLRNGYSDNSARRLAREFCPMRVHMSCTTTLHVAVKTEHVCRSRHHYMHFTSQRFAVGIHIPRRRAWSGFFTTVWQDLNTEFWTF